MFLKRIAFEIEAGQRMVRARKRDESKEDAKSNIFISLSEAPEVEDIVARTWLFRRSDPTVLDEVYLLLEDIRRARQDLPI